MSILDDIDDPALFEPQFRGGTWGPWRAFLAALFALPMSDDQMQLYRRHTGRETPPAVPFTEAALIVGRRGGKSRALATIAVHLATDRDYAPFLAPGEVATVALIAADRKQSRVIFRYISGMLTDVPTLAAMVADQGVETIVLKNRVVIEIHTASFRVTRGYSFAAVLADETVFWRSDESSANPDVEIFRALRPGLGSIPGAMLLNASSPYRRTGVLWAAYKDHYGRDDSGVLVWKATTAEMNPKISPKLIAKAYEDDPESAAAEYGAEFRTDIAAFVPREVVEACIEPGCYERARNSAVARGYVAFVDASGGSGSDSMTLAVAHREGDLTVLDAVRERRPPFSPEDVVREFAGLLRSYGITRAESDRWGGDWVGESFRKHGITVVPSAKPKSDLYREALPLLSARRCSLLDIPRLATQLCGLERRTARGGRDSIDHALNGHDDVANAVAGVLVLAGAGRAPMRISAEAMASLGAPDRHIARSLAL